MHREHRVHLREVDRHAAAGRQNVPLERAADTVGDHRDVVRVAQAGDRRHFVGRQRERDRVGRHRRIGRLVAPVLLAHARAGRHALAEQSPEAVENRGGQRTAGGLGFVHGRVHGWQAGGFGAFYGPAGAHAPFHHGDIT
jgi:hypothetical protein